MKISDKGFSLLEVIIAMAIFAIGAGGLYGMQLASAKGNAKANQQTGAVAAGTRFAEQLMKSGFTSPELVATIPNGVPHKATDLDVPAYNALMTAVQKDAPYVTLVTWTVENLGVTTSIDLSGILRIRLFVTYAENRTVDFNFLKIQMTDK